MLYYCAFLEFGIDSVNWRYFFKQWHTCFVIQILRPHVSLTAAQKGGRKKTPRRTLTWKWRESSLALLTITSVRARNSKSFSLHTIALTREDTRDCQGKRRVKCRIKYRPLVRNQGRWKGENFTVTSGDYNCDIWSQGRNASCYYRAGTERRNLKNSSLSRATGLLVRIGAIIDSSSCSESILRMPP